MALPAGPEEPRGQLTLELGHTPAHGEADFLVGEGNQLAYSRIMAFPDWPDPITLLIGPAKSGKSHLARIFADRSDARFAGVADLDTLATEGGTKPVVIEDVDRLDYGEAGLFHLLNQSMREQRPILMTAREEIAHWQLVTDDVRSRARRATAYTLELTDDIQLSQMFVKLFEDRQLKVDPRIVSYLVARMERSAEEAVLLADLMDRLALARATAVTRNIAAEALARRRLARGETDNTEQHLDTEDDE